ncbi:MAG: fibrobacter succinogenes major paralogous domain-containing protein, partial [Bacteroidales bacterium]
MRTLILSFILLILFNLNYAQEPGSIDNIEVSQRTGDEERVIDIAFTLSGGDYYAITLGIKFNGDDDFTPIQSGHLIEPDPAYEILDEHFDETIVGAIIVESGDIQLVWDGRESFSDIDAAEARVEITATRGMKDFDGSFYKSVLIGDQEWMAENLRVSKYKNGDAIPTGLIDVQWESTKDGAYAVYPHGDVDGIDSHKEMVLAYGKLYNWFAVGDSRGLCPAGWSVPSKDDWTQLIDYVVAQGFPNDDSYDPSGAGNALKSCRQVYSPLGGDCNTSEHPRWNQLSNGFDEFGFSALPGGARIGKFFVIGSWGHWWT